MKVGGAVDAGLSGEFRCMPPLQSLGHNGIMQNQTVRWAVNLDLVVYAVPLGQDFQPPTSLLPSHRKRKEGSLTRSQLSRGRTGGRSVRLDVATARAMGEVKYKCF